MGKGLPFTVVCLLACVACHLFFNNKELESGVRVGCRKIEESESVTKSSDCTLALNNHISVLHAFYLFVSKQMNWSTSNLNHNP